MKRTPFTRNGYEVLKKELEHLKKVDRPENIKAIEVARAHGDLSENAEYDAAKERKAFLDGRIGELSYKLGSAEIIDTDSLPTDRVVFASTVLLENIESGENTQYQLVGPEESDVDKGRISVNSPLGRAIIGKEPGDEVILQAPSGKKVFELVEIL